MTRIKYTFDDGTTDTLPLTDVVVNLQRQYAAMAASSDAGLRAKGSAKLLQLAEMLVKKESTNQTNRKNASKGRPTAKCPVRAKIIQAMASYRADHASFKDFMAAWEVGTIDGLRLLPIDATKPIKLQDEYLIDDENGDHDSLKPYKLSTLENKLWPEAKIHR